MLNLTHIQYILKMIVLIFMFCFLYLHYISAFDSDRGFRLKVVDSGENYVVKTNGKIRLQSAEIFSGSADASTVIKILSVGPNQYQLKYCEDVLSVKSTDPGIIAVNEPDKDNAIWEFIRHGEGYRLYNEATKQCLAITDAYDSVDEGFYLNRRNCDDDLKNVFNFFDAGLLMYFCEPDARKFCKDMKAEKRFDQSKERKRRPGSGNFGNKEDSSQVENSLSEEESTPHRRKEGEVQRIHPQDTAQWDSSSPPKDSDEYESRDDRDSDSHIIKPKRSKTHHGNLTEDEYHHHRKRRSK